MTWKLLFPRVRSWCSEYRREQWKGLGQPLGRTAPWPIFRSFGDPLLDPDPQVGKYQLKVVRITIGGEHSQFLSRIKMNEANHSGLLLQRHPEAQAEPVNRKCPCKCPIFTSQERKKVTRGEDSADIVGNRISLWGGHHRKGPALHPCTCWTY